MSTAHVGATDSATDSATGEERDSARDSATNKERDEAGATYGRTAGGGARRAAIVAVVVALCVVQSAVWTASVVVLTAAWGGSQGAADAKDLRPRDPDGSGSRTDDRPVPDRDTGDDDIWSLDGFADFSDARMRLTGGPGAGWTESRLSGRTVWVDDRCRVSAEVVDIGAGIDRDTDASASEDLARSIGATAFGGAETRSDPNPATIRVPLARGGRAVELASAAFVPAEPQRGDASFVVVSTRASVEHRRAVVIALACMEVPASQADVLARDLSGGFRLETRTGP